MGNWISAVETGLWLRETAVGCAGSGGGGRSKAGVLLKFCRNGIYQVGSFLGGGLRTTRELGSNRAEQPLRFH